MDLNRILVVLDTLEPEQPSLDRGMLLSKETGAELELFCVDFNEALTGDTHLDATVLHELRDTHTKEVLDWLAKLREKLASAGIRATSDAEYGRPEHEYILHRARETHPDLIIKSTRFHPIFQRNYFRASDWHLIKQCTAPLLFVKQAKPDAIGGPLLAAVDPFHPKDRPARLDRQLLAAATRFARTSKAAVHAVHAVRPLPRIDVSGESYYAPADIESAILEQRLGTVRETCRPFAIPDERIHMRVGSPQRVIPEVAAEIRAAAIVMGAVSRTSLKELFVGNTAEQVLEEVSCDVLVLHPGNSK